MAKPKNVRIDAANGPVPPTPGEGTSIFFPKAAGYNDGPGSLVSVTDISSGAPIPSGPDAMTERLGSYYGTKHGKELGRRGKGGK